jgi:predicted nucleotidyltransferase
MRVRSFDSVKVVSLNRERVREQVKSAVRRLAARRPEIKRAILFGSLARGDAVPGSDADILLILKSSPKPFMQRLSDYELSLPSIGTDVFPYTQDELDRMQKDGNPFIEQALEQGVEIYHS